MGYGTITAYALMSLEPRGTLFVNPGMEVGTYMISSCFYLSFNFPNLFSYYRCGSKDPIVYANYMYSR